MEHNSIPRTTFPNKIIPNISFNCFLDCITFFITDCSVFRKFAFVFFRISDSDLSMDANLSNSFARTSLVGSLKFQPSNPIQHFVKRTWIEKSFEGWIEWSRGKQSRLRCVLARLPFNLIWCYRIVGSLQCLGSVRFNWSVSSFRMAQFSAFLCKSFLFANNFLHD